MKSLMTNSTQPDIFAAKIRDEIYLKHLREVEKINNREAFALKYQLKQYHQISQSHQKSKRMAKQFDSSHQNISIGRKNDLINAKIKNIRSMFDVKNLQKSIKKNSDSLYNGNQLTINKENSQNNRYSKEKQDIDQINHISQQISSNIAQGVTKPLKDQETKKSRLSLNYYLRKRQQQMIEYENQKLKKGILTQKSAYSSPSRKINQSFKLPNVNSARYNFNEKSTQIETNKARESKVNQDKEQDNNIANE